MELGILDRIVAHKREELAKRKSDCPLSELERRIPALPKPVPVYPCFRNKERIQLIAEVKKASPSKGVIRPDFDPAAIAGTYERNGAAAISVLTDEYFFQGALEYLQMVRSRVRIPLLRKDFIVDPYQVTEARVYGADFVLLIAAVLSRDELVMLMQKARELSLGVLVEVHNEDDISKALMVEPAMIGINNRDLKTFRTDIHTTFRLLPLIPEGTIVISESGINTRDDVLKLEDKGVAGLLVGEALMREKDIGRKMRELIGIS
jgi:indole-3-glycerol phosphate synthase